MRQTLTAVFDNPGAAQHTLNKLLAAGFERADVTLSPAGGGNGATADAEKGQRPAAPGRHLFTHFLGMRGDHPESNPDSFVGGRHLLTLTTESETEARRAAALIGRLSASSGEDRLARDAGDGSRDGAPAAVPAAPGERFADEIAARRYGNEMHISEKYRNRSWDEVAPELSHDWKLRHPGTSDGGSEAAMRRGWDEASPEIDEDSYYRTHWNAEYAHAARPGQDHVVASGSANKTANSFQYHFRHRTAATADRKANWTLHHPGELSPWERFKDALLHGWGRISVGYDDSDDDSARDPEGRKPDLFR